MDRWFLIAHTPDGVHVHEAVDYRPGQPAVGTAAKVGIVAIDDEILAMRQQIGIPDDHVSRPGWNHSLAPGLPHKNLLAQIPTADGVPVCERCYRQPAPTPEPSDGR